MEKNPKEVWSVRISNDLKSDLLELMSKHQFKDPDELLNTMLSSFRIHEYKDEDPIMVTSIRQVEHYLNGIQEVFVSMLEAQRDITYQNKSIRSECSTHTKTLEEELTAAKERIELLEKNLELKEHENLILNDKNKQAEESLQLIKTMFEEFNKNNSTVQTRIEELQIENSRLQGQLEAADAALERYRRQNALSNINWNNN